jgi:small subunit ribosomal protein S6
MKKYDLTLLVRASLKEDGLDGFVEKIEKLVKILGGKMGKFTEMGKKQLAYQIEKVSEAVYLNWVLELPGGNVVELEKKLNNDKDVLRHLLSVTE